MALRLQIISDQRRLLGEHAMVVFGPRGGRIGRAADNDWVLPDPRRYLSAHHAAIRCDGDRYLVEDTSTNGVYANEAEMPVGRNNLRELQDGDTLRIGDYQLRVHLEPIDVQGSLSQELVAIDKVEPLRRTAGAAESPAAAAALSLETPASGALTTSVAVSAPSESDETGMEGSSRLSAIFDVRAGLHAFCRGAGIEVHDLRPDADLRVLLLAGQLLRESLLGLHELVRAQREFQLQLDVEAPVSTVAGPAPDAEGPADYLLKLLNGQEDGALDAIALLRAFQDACLRHEKALPEAFSTALKALLQQLDPESIEGRAIAKGDRSQAWPLYLELFRRLQQTAHGDLPRAFTLPFTQAYSSSTG